VVHRWLRFVAVVVVALFATAGVAVGPAHAAGPPTLDINSVSILEGDGGVGSLQFTVTLSNPPTDGTSAIFQFQTSPVTATEKPISSQCDTSHDYIQTFGSGSVNQAQPTFPINVNICSDTIDEPDETFQVTLFNISGATPGTTVGTGTILDNDPQPNLAASPTNLTEGNAGSTAQNVDVHLSKASGKQVTFTWQTVSGGTATAGTSCTGNVDYLTASGTGTIPIGATLPSTLPSITVCGDTRDEPNETIRLHLTNIVNANAPSNDTNETIIDDDATTATVAIADASASESAGTIRFPVSLSTQAGQQVTVNYQTSNVAGGATGGTSCSTAGVDYVTKSGSVSIAAGSLGTNIPITICNDTLDENNETFNVTITQSGAAGITDNSAVGTIVDDDATPTLIIDTSITGVEGNSGTTNVPALFIVEDGQGNRIKSGRPITFTFNTIAGTATGGTCGTAGVDYGAVANQTITINPGTNLKLVNVAYCGDTTPEADETFTYTVTNVVNAIAPASTTGTGTIGNDDGATVSIANVSTVEGNSGTHIATLRIAFSALTPAAGKLSFRLGGTAVKGSSRAPCGVANTTTDYLQRTTSPVSFAAKAKFVDVSFVICGDPNWEEDDTIVLTITSSDWVNGRQVQGTLTISNDDPFPG
jgi:hypothetical protein